jgi:hypothetical protein
MLFFQRFKGHNINKSLYVTFRNKKSDPWSKPANLGPMPVSGSSIPAIYSWSCDGSKLYFCDHPFAEPQSGGYGNSDIWYLPISVPNDQNGSTKVRE